MYSNLVQRLLHNKIQSYNDANSQYQIAQPRVEHCGLDNQGHHNDNAHRG